MKRPLIYFADLTHTAQGISAGTFPLGVSFVVSYAMKELGSSYELKLYKMPCDLERALSANEPVILACSNYSWNFELAYKFGSVAKARYPHLTFVMGGPNFPTVAEEQRDFLQSRPALDFHVQLEGEVGFVALVRALEKHDFDAKTLRSSGTLIPNIAYILEESLVQGPVERIRDVNIIPSPYLTGVMDPFFDLPLVPMIETTRGCPFTCTFCADGLKSKSKVTRFDPQRTREEVYYIAERLKNIDELVITDLNFAMYKEDIVTAELIAEVRAKHKWPVLLSASAGKNMPHRTIEVASILNGAWTLGASIQSTDPEVLTAIKRQNISSDAYRELVEFGNRIKTSKTHSEIILGLPGDTKEKHFTSLRFGVKNKVNSMRMFQAMLLRGTEMASCETRKEFGLVTKFRTIPGCVGMYEIFGAEHPISEIEEIIVGSKSLSFDDYLECRTMNLLVETFYNNALFEEVFGLLDGIGADRFGCLLYLKRHPELYPERTREIIEEFKKQTSADLFDTLEEAKHFVLTPEIVARYIGGELGINELLCHRAMLYANFEESCTLFFNATRGSLKEQGLLTEAVEEYLTELRQFVLNRKKDSITATEEVIEAPFHYDFIQIADAQFAVNPNDGIRLASPLTLRCFHTPAQKQHIANQVAVYSHTPIGLGRLIQRSNMRLMYRSVESLEGNANQAHRAGSSNARTNDLHHEV